MNFVESTTDNRIVPLLPDHLVLYRERGYSTVTTFVSPQNRAIPTTIVHRDLTQRFGGPRSVSFVVTDGIRILCFVALTVVPAEPECSTLINAQEHHLTGVIAFYIV